MQKILLEISDSVSLKNRVFVVGARISFLRESQKNGRVYYNFCFEGIYIYICIYLDFLFTFRFEKYI